MILQGKELFVSSVMFRCCKLCSDKYRINLNIPMKSVEQKDTEIFHKRIDQDRIMVIQVRKEYFIFLILFVFYFYRQLLYE